MNRINTMIAILFLGWACEEPESQDLGPETLWTQTYGGSGNELGHSVQQTLDGGFVVTGSTNSFGAGDTDVWLVRTDDDGDTLWTRTYGGGGSEVGNSVQQTSDGGFIITGSTYSFGAGSGDVWLIRTDANGDSLWTRTYGGSNRDAGMSVQQTADGGFVITGITHSFGAGSGSVWLIRTDANGERLWSRTYDGSSGSDDGNSVQQTSDGGFVVAGSTYSFDDSNVTVWLIRTDANGDSLWTRTYGGNNGNLGISVQQTTDGGFIVLGIFDIKLIFGGSSFTTRLIRTDASGDTLWTKSLGGNGITWGNSVQQTSDDGYVVAGYIDFSSLDRLAVWLTRTDANGESLWTRTFGGSGSGEGHSAKQTSDGGFVVTGSTNSFGASDSDIWLIRLGPE